MGKENKEYDAQEVKRLVYLRANGKNLLYSSFSLLCIMPFPNEHACRLKSPDDFKSESFKRITREHEGKEYSIIMGRLKGETTMTEQTYRYDKTKWTESQAKAHCKEHKGTFEPALKGEGEAETFESGKWIPVAKKNQTKILPDGGKIIATEQLLQNSVDTWKNGNIIINHKESIDSLQILDAKYEAPFLYMQFDEGTERLFRNTDATGWSVQFDPDSLQFDGDKIINGIGVGISILYPPHVPTCTPDMGCNETYAFEMYNDFEGKTLSKKNEMELKSIAEDVKKGFERLWSLLKGITTAKENKKEVENQERNLNLEEEEMEKVEELTSKLETTKTELTNKTSKFETATKAHEDEVKGYKEKIAEFENKEAEKVKAERDAQFEQIVAKLPPGMTHKEEDKTALRAKFDSDPTALMAELVSMERREGTGEEGSEFEQMANEYAKTNEEFENRLGGRA